MLALKVQQFNDKNQKVKDKNQKMSSDGGGVKEDILHKVALAKKFKEMTDYLGNRLMAAQVCTEFKMFLTAAELEDLEKNGV